MTAKTAWQISTNEIIYAQRTSIINKSRRIYAQVAEWEIYDTDACVW